MGPTRLLIVGLLACAVASGVGAEEFTARGACRDGLPQGVYELRGDNGRLRVLGAFNHGRRTGSFLFWTAAGVRIAHVPFDDDAINGTLSLWYEDGQAQPVRKLEAAYTANRRNGQTLAWQRDGRLRARVRYGGGELQTAEAWDESGRKLGRDEARAVASRDLAADSDRVASLLAVVKDHLPSCPAPPGDEQRAG